MKRGLLLLALWATAVSGFALEAQQAPEDWLGNWEQRVATPTYGLALLMVTARTNNGNYVQKPIYMPGMDFRIFNGTNASKGGGFYTGVEVGATTFLSAVDENFSAPKLTFHREQMGATPAFDYDVSIEGGLGMVYALAKYGYRLDLGFDLIGISIGAELGLGARIAAGELSMKMNVTDPSQSGRTYQADRSWGNGGSSTNLIVDAAGEASLRLGKNFRLFGRAGFELSPDLIPKQKADNSQYWDNTASFVGDPNHPNNDGAAYVSSRAKALVLLNHFDLEAFPIMPTARVGFSLSY
jgi:hypothetical protein